VQVGSRIEGGLDEVAKDDRDEKSITTAALTRVLSPTPDQTPVSN